MWIWTVFGWTPLTLRDDEPEPSGKDKVQALCDLAIIFGMTAEDAEQATFTELFDFVDAHMGKQD